MSLDHGAAGRRAALALVSLVAVGCGRWSPEEVAGTEVLEAAERAFVACAEARGAGIAELELGDQGVELLLYTSDTPEELYDTVARECEAAVVEVLRAGAASSTPALPAVPVVPAGVSGVDDYLAHLAGSEFTGAVLVGDLAGVDAAEGFGVADRKAGVSVTTQTAFDVGSVAKHFTAVAVLRQVAEGNLTLESSLAELFDDVPFEMAGITVGQLLRHESGLGEYHDTEGDFEAMTREEAIDAIFGHELLFEPGTDSSYSNSGYTLLAAIIEQVTGTGFEQVVTGLFESAAMRNTGFYGSAELANAPVATGYEGSTFGENSPGAWPTVSWALMGSGGVASSVEDLHRWVVAVHDGTLLEPAHEELLYREVLESSDVIDGIDLVGVSGANDYGFEVTIVELLDDGRHVVVATNTNPPAESATTEPALVLTQLLAGDGD